MAANNRWGGIPGKKKRFLARTSKSDGCWVWEGAYRATSPYGVCRDLDGKMTTAHRVSYALFVGDFDRSLVVCHSCDNPKCVNPEHLFIGTQQDNINDMIAKGRAAKGNKLNHVSQVGENNHCSKLTEDLVLRIRGMYNGGMSQAEIAKETGVKRPNVWSIVHRKSWTHI